MTEGEAGVQEVRRGPIVEGLILAALIGLGLQASLAVASAVYQGEHGIVFYVPVGRAAGLANNPWGADLLATWLALAAASSVAFAAAIRGAWRIAAILSSIPSAYLIAVAVRSAVAVSAERHLVIGLGPLGSVPDTRYAAFTATPGFFAIGALAACLAITAALWSRAQASTQRSWWWLAPAVALAATFSLVGDGNAAQGSPPSTVYPPQGGIMTVFQVLVASAIVVGLIWSYRRPQVGWAVGVLAIPFVIHQISDLTIGNFYYGYLYQPGWETALPPILAGTGIVLLIAAATLRAHQLRAS